MRKATTSALAAAATAALIAGPASAVPGPNTNTASYWSSTLSMTCTKTSVAGGMSWTADQAYGAVVVKGGSVDYGNGPGVALYRDVRAGDVVQAPLNAGDQRAAISWLITCDPGSSYPS